MPRNSVRVALIGPVPPRLGGASPGGVASHQAHLAAGLAEAPGVDAALLATNAHARSPAAASMVSARMPMYTPTSIADWFSPVYLRQVGVWRAMRYAAYLTGQRTRGSRRDVLGNTLWYRSFLGAIQPHVIHVQHPLERAYYVRLVASLERRRWPLVVTAHSFFGEHADEVIHTFMAPNLRAADRVIAVSPHIAEQAASLGVDGSRIHVIRSGIDVDRFQPRSQADARHALGLDERPLLLFVGNLEPRKQVDVALRALGTVCQRVPRVLLAIVGSGESAGALDQTSHLRQLTRDLQLDAAVRFLGRVDDATLTRWYAAADVFILPSTSEAQGIVALEAMACGLPVVASAVGGLLGTVEDGRTGYLVPPGEVEPLAQRLIELLCDTPRRREMGAAARATVAREFTWPRAVRATVDVYGEAVACRRTG